MCFPDFKVASTRSYVHHTEVLKYLHNYAAHFHLLPYIHFEHHLEKVTRNESVAKWIVTLRDMKNCSTVTKQFDVIFLAPGRYCIPKMPSIDSIDQFTGTAIHSHYYRHREPFTGQKVAIIGAGPSGLDICGEVATVAEQVILLNRRTPFKGMPANVQQINGEVLAFKDKSIAISIDGNAPVEFSINSVIFATGYLFNLPYLDSKSCGLSVNDDQTIAGLYRHLINIEQPSMALMSVLIRVLPFPLFHQQVIFFVKHVLGEVQLPPKDVMIARVSEEFAKRRALGFRPQDRHLTDFDLHEQYHNELVEEGQIEPLAPVVLKFYRHLGAVRAENIHTYKEKNYQIVSDENFEETVDTK